MTISQWWKETSYIYQSIVITVFNISTYATSIPILLQYILGKISTTQQWFSCTVWSPLT